MPGASRKQSFLKIMGVYIAASWVCLQVVDVLTQNIELPPWVFTFTLTLLALGLPVTAIAAYFVRGEDDDAESMSSGGLLSWGNVGKTGIVLLAVWGVVITGWVLQTSKDTADSERTLVESLDEIRRLAGEYKFGEGFAIAEQLDGEITDDSVRDSMWSVVSRALTIETDPPGATVYRRDYVSDESDWEELGISPVDIEHFPLGLSRLRFELDGYIPRETSDFSGRIAAAGTFVLDTPETMPEGMTRVSGGTATIQAPGLEQFEALDLMDFFIDIHEVTNRQYKAFMDAGGYSNPACWTEPFVQGDDTLSFEDAMKTFVDQTGRPGPSSWQVGTYPQGADELPVGGVSWYEAAAYACFVGKSLPTVYHWFMAADPYSSNHVVPLSNYSGQGKSPVGQYDGQSRDGASDMAGNVREWALNPDGDARYILGGGWNDPEYAFNDAVTSPAFDRSAENGIRLVKYQQDPSLAAASVTIEKAFRDFTAEEPVSDEVFEVYRQLYAYDASPLNAAIVETIEEPNFTRQQVELDAAYGDERLTLFLFIPKAANALAPYQTVLFFPGSNDIYKTSYDELSLGSVEFIVRSGRAMVYPIYKGTYARGTDLTSDIQNAGNLYRDHVIAWSRDVSRSIDYLETRDDIDKDRLAYLGFSWGAAMSPIMLATESRFAAAVLYVGGLMMQEVQPVADTFNFLPRVTVPLFMFNGRYDSFFPMETSVYPFFERIGTPAADKKLTVTDANHFVAAYNANQLISETLDWLDKYLGKVGQK